MFGSTNNQFLTKHCFCGCWFPVRNAFGAVTKQYLPQVVLQSHTTVLAVSSKTVLKQTFINDKDSKLDEVQYSFPLYDGVSVVAFKCTVASKTITGVVKEKQQARKEYSEAVAKGETAGLLEQLPEASDVFTTKIGNVPAHEKIYVEIIYVGELKHDTETNGTRFTIPTQIAPRYGPVSHDSASTIGKSNADDGKGIQILVDVELEKGAIIKSIQSPSHPIAVTVGRTSSMPDDAFDGNHGSATLTLGSTELDKDFVLIVLGTGQESPRALLETHPNIPNHRALMVTLVPKFNIPNIIPEIVFIVDRSGSMDGKISTVVAAMKIFLKSLPNNGVKFNICSFGSRYSFLFEKSRTYDQSSLNEALQHLETFRADHGGTEMLNPIKATIENRFSDMPLEVLLLTDGEIWNQDALFDYVNQQMNARFFTLGIGHGASSALVEGIARAGDGFAQFVSDNEKMDKKIVRMLKGALTPHVLDYSLEVHYDKKGENDTSGDDFEIIESFKDSANVVITDEGTPEIKEKISLFNEAATEEPTNAPGDRYEGLPKIETPAILQAPHKIPSLFPFVRTTVYLLMSPAACQTAPKSVVLKGTSDHGPLELEIPVQDAGKGETFHQLAAKKAVQELEDGRGWITETKVAGELLKSKYPGRWDLLVEREAVRLGVQFQVGGKWCSFVAVEKKDGDASGGDEDDAGSGHQEMNLSHVSRQPNLSGWQKPQSSRFAFSYPSSKPSSPTSNFAFNSWNPQPVQQAEAMSFGAHQPSSLFGSTSFGANTSVGWQSCSLYANSSADAPHRALFSNGAANCQSGFGSPLSGPTPTAFCSAPRSLGSNAFRHTAPAANTGITFGSQPQNSGHALFSSNSSGGGLFSSNSSGGSLFGTNSSAVAPFSSNFSGGGNVCSLFSATSAPSTFANFGGKFSAGANMCSSTFGQTISPPEESQSQNNLDTNSTSGTAWPALTPDLATQSLQTFDSDDERMRKLIEMQEFDGSWKKSEVLWNLLSLNNSQLDVEKVLGTQCEQTISTVLAIAWLQKKMPQEEGIWEMVVGKAVAWLETNNSGSVKVEVLVEKAKGLFSDRSNLATHALGTNDEEMHEG